MLCNFVNLHMKWIVIISLSLISIFCKAQTDTIIKRDSLKFNIIPLNFYSLTEPKDYFIPSMNYSNVPYTTSRFTYYYSTQYGSMFYDNIKHEYYSVNGYGNVGGALVFGTLRYLFLLFDNRN